MGQDRAGVVLHHLLELVGHIGPHGLGGHGQMDVIQPVGLRHLRRAGGGELARLLPIGAVVHDGMESGRGDGGDILLRDLRGDMDTVVELAGGERQGRSP
jgi:hypothetical protein